MNILVLEHPRIPSEKHFNDIANTPLWSCLMAGYAAASIQQTGCRAELLDANAHQWDFEKTAQEIIQRDPDLLCVHAVYFWEHTAALFDFLDSLRALGFEGHINLFGVFATLSYPVILKQVAAVDSIAVGEFEHTLAGLTIRMDSGKNWREIPGLAVCDRRRDAVFLCRKRIPEPNPDVFPFPLRQSSEGETAGILASRGCYNHCRFCPVPAFYSNGPMWRGRAPEMVAEEITQLRQNGINDFYFLDPNFIGPGRRGKERTRSLCKALAPLHIAFGMETRANDLNPDILHDLKAAGLRSLLIGLESGSARILDSLEKHGSIEQSEAAISMCRDFGIEPEVGFLMFVPDATVEDLAENFHFLARNTLLDRLDRTANLLCHRQIIFMGTSGYQMFKTQGRLTPQGPLGFQAEAAWLDPKVRWMADVVGYACLRVLSETGNSASPLYWKKHNNRRACNVINDYLVNLFEQCLKTVSSHRSLSSIPKISTMQKQIQGELRERICRMDPHLN